ncbi:MAG: hypothetical protein M3177_00370, partial [Pseudomonadota bacterium]|nr:hypothetical protein [Pseudomonadota bacterium]
MYCEYLRHRPFLTVEEYLAAVDVDGFSWRRVVGALCKLVGAERVTLWRYEEFAALENQVFAAFCGSHGVPLQKPVHQVRESLSARAVASLTALVPVLSREEIRTLVEPVSAALPKDAQRPGLEAFTPARAAALRERYEQDLAAIAREFPGLRILGPDISPAQPAAAAPAPPPAPVRSVLSQL